MRTSALGFAVALAACHGNKTSDTGAGNPDLCNQMVAQPFGEVPADQWPDGVREAAPLYTTLNGRWAAQNSCGDPVYVKFITKTEQDLDIITTPYPAGAGGCGCTVDPDFGDDTQYDPVLTHDGFQFYVESWPDPGLNSQTLLGNGALFGQGQPMTFRSCGLENVDPVLNSAYDTIATIARLEGDSITATIVLTPFDGEPETCELSGFVQQ